MPVLLPRFARFGWSYQNSLKFLVDRQRLVEKFLSQYPNFFWGYSENGLLWNDHQELRQFYFSHCHSVFTAYADEMQCSQQDSRDSLRDAFRKNIEDFFSFINENYIEDKTEKVYSIFDYACLHNHEKDAALKIILENFVAKDERYLDSIFGDNITLRDLAIHMDVVMSDGKTNCNITVGPMTRDKWFSERWHSIKKEEFSDQEAFEKFKKSFKDNFFFVRVYSFKEKVELQDFNASEFFDITFDSSHKVAKNCVARFRKGLSS